MDSQRPVKIERATEGDLPALQNVFQAMLDEVLPLGGCDPVEARGQFKRALQTGVASVLWCGDLPAGFDAWEVVEAPGVPAVCAEVAVWVHPSWRRERRATCLRTNNLRALAERFRGRPYLLLSSTSPRNVKMQAFLTAQGAQASALLFVEEPKAAHLI